MKPVFVGVGIGSALVAIAAVGVILVSISDPETEERDVLTDEPDAADVESEGSEAVADDVGPLLELADLRVWREAGFPARESDEHRSHLFAVIEHDGGFLAVGANGGAAGSWWSPDGRDWEFRDDPGGVLGDPSMDTPTEDRLRMNDVARVGDDLIAVGQRDERRESGNAIAWIAPGGGPWERAQVVGPADGEGEAVMSAVAANDDRLVAVGWMGTDAAVWTSTDGRRWDHVDQQADFRGSRSRFINAVVADGPGFVAVGSEWNEQADGEGQAMVWTSIDGLVWRQSDSQDLDSVGAQFAHGVVAMNDQLVAAGYDERTGEAAIWRASDGASWSRLSDQPDLGGPGQQQIWSLVPASGGLMAVGTGHFADDDWHPAVWLSPDGLSWERVPGGGGSIAGSGASVMLDAAVSEQHATVVGWAWEGTGAARPASWFTHPGASPETSEATEGTEEDEPQPGQEAADAAAPPAATGDWQPTPGFDGLRESRATNTIPGALASLVGRPAGLVIESEMRCTRQSQGAGVDCTVAEGSVSGEPNEILNGFLTGFDENDWDDVTTSAVSQGGGIIASRGTGPSPREAFVVTFVEASAGTFDVVISLETYD